MINHVKTAMLLASLMALFSLVGAALGGEDGIWLTFGIAILTGAYAYVCGPQLIIAAHHAQEIDRVAAAALIRRVAELSNIAGIPAPRIFVSDNPQPNAFVVGRNHSDSIIILTSTLLTVMSEDELLAIIGHEITHIKSYDTVAMTVAAIFTCVIAAVLSPLILIGFFARRGKGACFTLPAAAALITADLLHAILSRSREYAADKGSAALCGRSDWLVSALLKLNDAAKQPADPIIFATPQSATARRVDSPSDVLKLFYYSSHPPIASRIERLMMCVHLQ